MRIPFMKMSGSGNDFILIGHREPFLKEDRLKEFVQKVCRRRVSVGADGLILIILRSKAEKQKRVFFEGDVQISYEAKMWEEADQ